MQMIISFKSDFHHLKKLDSLYEVISHFNDLFDVIFSNLTLCNRKKNIDKIGKNNNDKINKMMK